MITDLSHLVDHLRTLASSTARVSADSRQIQKGDLFFAYPVGQGSSLRDGRDYIAAALEAGAAAVVFDPAGMGSDYLDHPQCFAVENLAMHVGQLCSSWYGDPSAQLGLIGVTGTNGKTSITQWLAQALDSPSRRVAVLGTLGSGFPEALVQTGYTTPDAPRLQTQLKELLAAGATQIAMEVSSHALDQGRTLGIAFDCAVLTNLTQDHLDYHGSMVNYAEAKAKLFHQSSLQHIVLNFDDAFGRELAMTLLAKDGPTIWGYALRQEVFNGFEKFGERLHRVYVKESNFAQTGYDAVFECEGVGAYSVHAALLGDFNLSNSLAVWAVLLSQGLSGEEAAKRIAKLRPVVGRMEIVTLNKNQPLVVVDYAHTPDALEKALLALRPIAQQRAGKIWCVFGCGGDRDANKRPKMGAVAEKHADHIIITSDNPRSENPESIMEMIRLGIKATSTEVQTIADRAVAIMTAVRHAQTNDVVLVAGKGHESTQEVNGKKFEFSDREHIQLAAGGTI